MGSAPGAGSPSAPKDAGGQFATLQSYLTANQGQAAPLANKITSGIQGQYNALQGQNASTLSGIQGQVAQGYTPENQDILSQEAANPVSFASNPGNVQSFQKQLSNQYTGPQSAESSADYQKQQGAINNAIATGTAQTGSAAGREQLLQQTERRPTTGVTALNSAILTQSPDYLSQVQGAYKPFSNLLTGLSTGAQGVNAQIGQATTEAQDSAQKANKQISDQINALNTNVNSTVAQDEIARQKYNTDLQSYQNQVGPISTNINSLNEMFKNAPVQTDWGGNYGQLVNPLTPILNQTVNNNVANPNAVATTDQYAQAAAFQNLLNGLNLGTPSPILDQSTANLAGTYIPQAALNAPQGSVAAQQIADSFNKAIDPTGPGPSSMNPAQLAFFNQYNPTWMNLLTQLKQLNPNLQGQ